MTHYISFSDYRLDDCLPPSSIPVGPSLSILKSRGVKVFWIPDSAKFNERYKLDLDSGSWQQDHRDTTDVVLEYSRRL
ncbi:hypothetical protein BSL78_16055 [Apostichopus japonicus]|uniref:Uncharacterized protein n=1 Tax=Stichopus japonicus TaxID=307972 RepID=A0A2G8KGJ6_STIJA|nr:hypothetical protein BSL78_16055 [Apostichopus japonicus]